jgi:quinol-cytochrome oxidoreductase complex cytochrome b subunit
MFYLVNDISYKKKILNQKFHFLVIFIPLVVLLMFPFLKEGKRNEKMNKLNKTLGIIFLLIPIFIFILRKLCGYGRVPFLF